ncbi:MAG: phosphoadenylyl-sulfate reductase [Acidobacteriota bacterium]|jgi:phosphoadenosine phosphosulfate reductase
MENRQEHRTRQILRWVIDTFEGEWKLATAFGIEGMVLIDLLSKLTESPPVFTIDTGRLPQETYDLMERVRARYGLELEVFYPQTAQLEELVTLHGVNLFYESIEKRETCCRVRKVEPLQRALSGVQLWMSGLRRGQSNLRARRRMFEHDQERRIKVYPLLDWTTEAVWEYICRHDVPYNRLYDQGYTSVGCAPCSRPTQSRHDLREGRWWWENDSKKECGLHA